MKNTLLTLLTLLTFLTILSGCGEDSVTNSGSTGNGYTQDSLMFSLDTLTFSDTSFTIEESLHYYYDSCNIKLTFTAETNIDSTHGYAELMIDIFAHPYVAYRLNGLIQINKSFVYSASNSTGILLSIYVQYPSYFTNRYFRLINIKIYKVYN